MARCTARATARVLMLDLRAVHHAEERPSRAPYPTDPRAQCVDRTGLEVRAAGHVRVYATRELVFLRAAQKNAYARSRELEALHVETGELAGAKGACEAEQDQRAVAIIARRASEGGEHLEELVLERMTSAEHVYG